MAQRETNPIGQLLVERGWITSEQLSTALSRQRELGGRLGTALLEMGVVAERWLVKALAEQSGLRPADAEDLHEIPPAVVELLPAKAAAHHRAIPFRTGRGRVDVALSEEPKIPDLDELAFVLGRRPVLHVANEARIYEALERYYGAECPLRFSQLLDRLNHAREVEKREPPGPQAAPTPAPPSPTRRAAAAATPAAAAAAAAVARQPQPPQPRPTSVPLSPDEQKALRRANRPDKVKLLTQDEVQQALQAARNAQDIGRALLGFLGQEFLRLLIFRVGKGRVRGWLGRSPALDEYAFRNWTVGFDEPSVFLNLRQGAEFFLGRLPAMAAHERLLKCWRGTLDTECAVFPVRVRDRLVCAIYGDRDSLGLVGLDVQAIQRLTAKAAIAFEMLLMQRKLRS